jgi:2-iminobutanoate/2-iminopropanoate deaminase
MPISQSMTPQGVVLSSLPSPLASHHSHAIISGGLVFVSGLVAAPLTSGGRIGVTSCSGQSHHDVAKQMRSIFDQLDQILTACNSQKNHVIDVQVFLRELEDTFPIMNAEFGAYFGSHKPSRTTVEVVRFPSEVIVEVKVIAAVRNSEPRA